MSELWGINALATELGIDRATITRALQDVPPANEDGKWKKWRMKDALKALGMGRERANSRQQLNDVERATADLRTLQADKQRIQLAKIRGEVVPTDAAIQALEAILLVVRTRVMEIPTKAAPRLKGLKTEQQVKAKLEDYIASALTDISNFNPEDILGELRRATERPDGDAEEDGTPSEVDGEPMGRRKKGSVA